MSRGHLVRATHAAVAMNRIGGKTNTGEGGEDASATCCWAGERRCRGYLRRDVRPRRGPLNPAIKQVASARFGVTMGIR
jgi:glutamate synthase domain-containing protein 2